MHAACSRNPMGAGTREEGLRLQQLLRTRLGKLGGAIVLGLFFMGFALAVAAHVHQIGIGASLVGTSLILEAQPAALAAVALGMPPRAGALIVIAANLAPLPALNVGMEELVTRWPWAQRKLLGARRWALRYRTAGPLIFIPLTPFIGAYAATAVGRSLGFRPVRTWWTVLAGMLWSVAVITYGGHWVAHLFTI